MRVWSFVGDADLRLLCFTDIGVRAGGSLGVSNTLSSIAQLGLSQPQPSTFTSRTSHDSLFHPIDVTNPSVLRQRGMDMRLPRDNTWT
jgi:hypothetical protein